MFGELEVVLFDGRAESPTEGLVSRVFLTQLRRQMLRIPPGVWHAIRALGDADAVIVNFPTTLYEHDNPDKFGLPLQNDVIPYRF